MCQGVDSCSMRLSVSHWAPSVFAFHTLGCNCMTVPHIGLLLYSNCTSWAVTVSRGIWRTGRVSLRVCVCIHLSLCGQDHMHREVETYTYTERGRDRKSETKRETEL